MMTPLPIWQALAVILVVAAVTFFCRALPFMLFRDNRPISGAVIYLGRVLPYAIISILVIYCLRNIQLTIAPFGAPELIACAIAAALHVWKRSNLLSIGVSTVVYMLLVQMVFH